eukprot:scaffold1.g5488.t1
MYGENAFRVQRTIFQSELDAAKKAKQINFTELEKRAREYAKARGGGGGSRGGRERGLGQQGAGAEAAHCRAGRMREEAKSRTIDSAAFQQQQQQLQQPPLANGGAPVDTEMAEAAAPKPAEEKKPEVVDLPEGWAVAYDAQKRPYYWHRVTKKVQWDKPDAHTPTT